MRRRLLFGCFVASIAVHLALAARFAPDPDETQLSESPGAADTQIGSFEDLVAGMDVPDNVDPTVEEEVEKVEETKPIDPVSDVTEPVDPTEEVAKTPPETDTVVEEQVEPEPLAPQQAAAVEVPEAPETTEPVRQAALSPVLRDEVTPVMPVPPDATEATVEPVEPVRPKDVVEEPVEEPTVAETRPEDVREVEPEPVEKAVEAPQQVAAVQPEADIVEPVVAPLPAAKPEIERPQKPRKPEKETRRKPRNRGNAPIDSPKGGNRNAGRSAQAEGTNTRDAGDGGRAARTNYRGQVQRRLARASRSVRGRIRGMAMVSFVVARNGTVSGVRISQSSGEPAIDEAALAMVARASDMPAFPAEIPESSMSFRIPFRSR